MPDPVPALHFVGFRGDEYTRAVRLFGRPDFIHRGWDRRASREIHPLDTVVFATGTAGDSPRDRNYDDLDERVFTDWWAAGQT